MPGQGSRVLAETVVLSIEKDPGFGEFVAKSLDDLYQQFRSRVEQAVEGRENAQK